MRAVGSDIKFLDMLVLKSQIEREKQDSEEDVRKVLTVTSHLLDTF